LFLNGAEGQSKWLTLNGLMMDDDDEKVKI
jgi:hypothetical protein